MTRYLLEVTTLSGKTQMSFDLATPEQAQALKAELCAGNDLRISK
jgi:hypothetical protein